jgi:AraC-like DNA-binding protein
MRVNGESYFLTPETAVAVNPWELHGYVPESSEGQYILVLYIKPSWFGEHKDGQRDALTFGKRRFSVTPEISAKVRQLAYVLADGGSGVVLNKLLYELTETCYSMSHESSRRADREIHFGLNDFRVRKSLRILNEHDDLNLDIGKLASEAGLSRPHFFKLFRGQIGIPPKLFWNTLRLERAFRDLVETPKSIGDISFELGFSSQSSFSRFFCLNTGMAPSDYRRVGHVVSS